MSTNETASSPQPDQPATPKRKLRSIADVLVRDIERTLRRRTQPPDSTRGKIEARVKHHGARIWIAAQRRPTTGALLVGGVGLVGAAAIGTGELVVGFLTAYAAYRVFTLRDSPEVAIEALAKDLERLS